MKVLLIVLCTIIAGCAVGPDFKRPSLPSLTRYTFRPLPEKTQYAPVVGGEAQHFAMQELPLQWWKLLGSAEINYLVSLGLQNHPSLEGAQAAIREAKANLRAQTGFLMFPKVDFTGSVSRQKFSSMGGTRTNVASGSSASSGSSVINTYNALFNVSYVFDLFGGNRRAIEALCAQVDYQRYQLEGVHLNLSSNIAITAITIADLSERIEATHQLIHLEKETLEIIKKQFNLGAIAQLDVINQTSQLAQLQTTLPSLELQLRQNQHALIQLIGHFPSETRLPRITLSTLHLPPVLPIRVPATLVQHRPDIRAQEALLHQASAQIGVKTAQLLPQISLTGFGGWQSSDFIWNITGQIAQPIFHGGGLLAQRKAAVAVYDQVLAKYRETVLVAFQNVADALSAIEMDAIALKAYTESESATQKAYRLTEQQYHLGANTYLNVLIAKRAYQQAVLARIQAQAKRYSDSIALFQALGGTWWTS